MLVCTVEVMGPSHFAGAGRDALPRVRRWMSRRFFLLFLRTRFVTFAEGFPWTCEAGSRVPTIAFRRIARERVLLVVTSSVNQIGKPQAFSRRCSLYARVAASIQDYSV